MDASSKYSITKNQDNKKNNMDKLTKELTILVSCNAAGEAIERRLYDDLEKDRLSVNEPANKRGWNNFINFKLALL